jgi:tRNA dimethylallyltransferase
VNGHNQVTSHESPVTSHCLPRLVIIQGPTATGKSELAVQLAEQFNGEIVGADSLQVYRGMVIGSAAPGPDLTERVPHHLIGIAEPDAPFTAADYVREAGLAISGILQRGRIPFVVGGTGLYIRALLGGLIDVPPGNAEIRRELDARVEREGTGALLWELELVDPETAARLHPNDQVRIVRALEICRVTGRPFSHLTSEHCFKDARYEVLKIGLTRDRAELYRRVEERVDRMLAVGLVDEVQGLLAQGFPPDLKSMRAIGYKEICRYLVGDISLDEATGLIKRDTKRYVKRQQTWFFRDSATKWFEYPENFASIQTTVEEFIVSSP